MQVMKRLATILIVSACSGGSIEAETDPGPDATTVALVVPPTAGYTLAPTMGCYQSYGASSMVLPDGTVNVWNGAWNCPVPTEVGQAISSVSVAVRDNGASNGHATEPNVVTASLVLQSTAGESTLMSAASAGTGTQQTISMTAAPHAILAGETLVMRMSPTTTTTPPHFAVWPSALGGMQIAPAAGPMRRRNIPLALQWANPTNSWAPTDGGVRSVSTAGITQGATSIDVPFEIGDTINGAEVWRFSDGTTGNKAALVFLAAGNNTIIVSGNDTIDSTATTRAMYTIPAASGVNHTMTAGERLRLVLFAKPSAGYTIDSVNLLYTPAP